MKTITREQYVHLIGSVGFDARDLKSLEFRVDGIYAVVMERNKHGAYVIDAERNEVATSKVFIRVVDE